MKGHLWSLRLTIVAASVVCALLLGGCSDSGSSTAAYMAQNETSAVFLSWTRTGDTIVGNLSMALPSDDGLSKLDSPLTGSVSGQQVTLNTETGVAGTPTRLTGVLSDRGLHLEGGDIGSADLVAATRGQYDAAVAELLPRVSQTQTVQPQAPTTDDAMMNGIHTLQVGVQSYAVDHNAFPAAADQATLQQYVDIWPTNPYTGSPMAPGNGPGDYWYTNYGSTFKLDGFGSDGAVLITVP